MLPVTVSQENNSNNNKNNVQCAFVVSAVATEHAEQIVNQLVGRFTSADRERRPHLG